MAVRMDVYIIFTTAILSECKFMPIFEYLCQDCNHLFEAILLGSTRAQCPKCESKRLEQQISRFAVSGSSAAERAQDMPAAGACGRCGDPRGPGACSN